MTISQIDHRFSRKWRIQICKTQLVCFSLLIGCAFFLWWRCSHGYIYNDEPFILTLGQRLLKGDIFLVEEWQPAQLTGFLIYPFIKLFSLFHADNTGIILWFRHVYVILWTCCILFVYQRMSVWSSRPIITVVACLYLQLFASLDMMTLSYNFYSMAGILICLVLLITAKNGWDCFFAGIAASVATVACPYLAAVFIIYLVLFFLYRLLPFRRRRRMMLLEWRPFLQILAGILFSAILFVIFFLRHGGTFKAAAETIPIILSDSEYPYRSAASIVKGIWKAFSSKYFMFFPEAAGAIAASLLDRKRKWLYFLAHVVLFFVAVCMLCTVYLKRLNYQMIPLALLGLHALLISRRESPCLGWFYAAGWVYALVLYTSSDLRELILGQGLAVAGFVSLFLIDDALREMVADPVCPLTPRQAETALFLVCSAQLCCETYTKYMRYYAELDIKYVNTAITVGPAAGITSSWRSSNDYMSAYNDFNAAVPAQSNLLVLSLDTWLYLENDGRYCTYSSWMAGSMSYRLNRLKLFYSLHPDREPDYVYILLKDYQKNQDLIDAFFSGYTKKTTSFSVTFVRNQNG